MKLNSTLLKVGGLVLNSKSVLITKHAEDEDVEDGSDEEPLNGLVEALFDEIEHLRLQVRLRSLVVAPSTR